MNRLAILLCGIGFTTAALDISGNGIRDFGEYSTAETQEHTFVIRNDGTDPVTLGNTRSTCGCLAGELSRKELKPGEEASLKTRIAAHSVTGVFERTIYIESSEPGKRFLRLILKGNARPLLTVEPEALLYAGTLAKGKAHTFRFKLSPTQPGVKLQSLPELKDGVLTLTVPADQPAGRFTLKREIKIESPAGWPPIKIEITGEIRE